MKTIRILFNVIMVWAATSAVACFAQKSPDVAMNEKVIRQYYAAYEKKDWSMLEAILDEGFTFSSPAGDDHISLKEYKERCWPNSANTKKFELEHVVVSGDDAYVTYNGSTNSGKLFRNTERFKLRDGKIVENECFFGPGVSFPNNEPKK
ncbi:MAG TPA: nuclear transport factor 2 family protein [Opitutaceae bacterium]|jgi:ketosteroid isomerase-like protein|nr:nuclear transport factor 2 family protein [Opitutaceae bacterium]